MGGRLMWLLGLIAIVAAEGPRWSRQLSSYTSDLSDWVPLPGPVQPQPLQQLQPQPLQQLQPQPLQQLQQRKDQLQPRKELPQPRKDQAPIKRQIAEPRILAEPYPGFARPTGFNRDIFPPNNYYQAPAPSRQQLYLQSLPAVPSAPQNFLSDQGFGQSLRFGLSQPTFPLNQGFVSPQFAFDSIPPVPQKQRPQQQPQQLLNNPVKFENYQKPSSQLSTQAKPFVNQAPIINEAPKFVDGYRIENATNNFAFPSKKKPQSLQKLKYENYDTKLPSYSKPDIPAPTQSNKKIEREEVQLLYVPVESLNRGQFNFRNSFTSPQSGGSEAYSQSLQKQNSPSQSFAADFQRPVVQPIEKFSIGQNYYSNINTPLKDIDQVPKYSSISSPFPTLLSTTPKPKKLRPHQPPLAIFLAQEAKKGAQIKVGDVLSTLKNANTIAVLDSVHPSHAPKVFIGPSSLSPPENFVKFELPYLSNIENSDRKLKQMPFFVAPLSYHTPDGFAKIPFPSPHVGSVVINAQIKDTTSQNPIDVIPNSYSSSPASKAVTQKPTFSYYSTTPPKKNLAPSYQSNRYSFEPQTVSSIAPSRETESSIVTAPPKPGSYFLSNVNNQYDSQYVNYPSNKNRYHQSDSQKSFEARRAEASSTPTSEGSSTTLKSPSTYPSQLLETHNPYSINSAFHLSTPLDYQNSYDDLKDGQSTAGISPEPPSSTRLSTASTLKPEVVTENREYYKQSTPNYLQNYSPEIHYESEVQNSRYNVYNTNDYSVKPESSSEKNQQSYPIDNSDQSVSPITDVVENSENTQFIAQNENQPTKTPYAYNLYETANEYDTSQDTTTSTSTTTTKKTPLRTRGRPRYPSTKADSSESTSTRPVSSTTRRPIRERRPLPQRPKYEPNKITTEKLNRQDESNESTTKTYRGRQRGRVQYKTTDSDYEKRGKGKDGKDNNDIAYQRDVLHQNYPVTLTERHSTLDIEPSTESSSRFSSTKSFDISTEAYDTENAYTNEKSVSQQFSDLKEETDRYTAKQESQTESYAYVPRLSSTRRDENVYQSRSSFAPIDAVSGFDESSKEKEIDYSKPTTPLQSEENLFITESLVTVNEPKTPNYVATNDQTTPEPEITKSTAQEISQDFSKENVVQTTSSYNRVRVRPASVRQYQQTSSTESSRIKSERKQMQAVTYRPAFERRRTTMRIDEIEADLKTKPLRARHETEYRHPVYKPEPSTEGPSTVPISTEPTKRGQFRRRRPSYSTSTTTEASSTKKGSFDTKNRFRGRRPTTEKSTEKIETKLEATTVRSLPYNRYNSRPRLSERFNKKPEQEESDDQDSNYSINRPKYASAESDLWSPKFSGDSFKPYNPNDIMEDSKLVTTERRSDVISELDIITARNEYDDILLTVTPASNKRLSKNVPDVVPTLEALVEQSKSTNNESTDKMSTFETMLEEVMKSLEEKDEDEYSPKTVVKHKGGEIGEIPPEENQGTENAVNYQTTTAEPVDDPSGTPNQDISSLREEDDTRGKRRGYWKKVKVRPISTESIEAAESQYYSHTVNRIGEPIKSSKTPYDKNTYTKTRVTTYKPNFNFLKEMFENDKDPEELPLIDVPKLIKNSSNEISKQEELTTEQSVSKSTAKEESTTSDIDLGTGSPDPTVAYELSTEPAPDDYDLSIVDRSDGYSIMDYLFGTTANGNAKETNHDETNNDDTNASALPVVETTDQPKTKWTTEGTFIPEEITEELTSEDSEAFESTFVDIKKVNSSENVKDLKEDKETIKPEVVVESSSVSSFMDPANVVSTSMSTEVSHETEICFRGKCIKTNKEIAL